MPPPLPPGHFPLAPKPPRRSTGLVVAIVIAVVVVAVCIGAAIALAQSQNNEGLGIHPGSHTQAAGTAVLAVAPR
jgi:hypothetical protein